MSSRRSARTRPGTHVGRRSADRRKPGLSGRGRVRRTVHREHDVDGRRVPRHLGDGIQRRAGARSREAARRPRGRRARDGSAEAQRAAAADHHARCDRERDRIGRRDRRIDQRRAAPARDRARGGRRAEHRRLRSHQRESAAAGRPEAERALRCDRHVQSGWRAADCEAAEGRRHSQELGADGDRQDDRRRSRSRRPSRRARKSCGRSRIR